MLPRNWHTLLDYCLSYQADDTSPILARALHMAFIKSPRETCAGNDGLFLAPAYHCHILLEVLLDWKGERTRLRVR